MIACFYPTPGFHFTGKSYPEARAELAKVMAKEAPALHICITCIENNIHYNQLKFTKFFWGGAPEGASDSQPSQQSQRSLELARQIAQEIKERSLRQMDEFEKLAEH